MRFVHVPKTGGISFSKSLCIQNLPHVSRCEAGVESVVVIREPLDRFQSMYRFWKYGSNGCVRAPGQFERYSVGDYIDMICNRSRVLLTSFTREEHYLPQSYWLPEESYSSSIVVRYCADMEGPVRSLFSYLGISVPFSTFNRLNVSKGVPVVLSVEEEMWVREYYKVDFELWAKLQCQPALFKKVV
jgi:hypothetical protein